MFPLIITLTLLLPQIPSSAEEEPSDRTEKTEAKTEPVPLKIPASARNRKNPIPNVPTAIEAGRNLYSSQCAMCHGSEGDGKGDLVVRLKLDIPDLRDPRLQKRRTDGELFYILDKGHGDMPAEKRLADKNKWEIVHYMRTFKKSGAPK
jgi:mono/diheme cytochrome c family protein